MDQPTYTAADKLYPEGPLYWRVQPIDGAGNALGWSETRTVVKRSERPTLVSPISASPATSFPGHRAVRWDAQPFAGKYEIQVAKNGDTNFSATNLVVATRSTTQAGVHDRVSTAKVLPAASHAVRVAGPPYRPAEQRRPLVRLRVLLLASARRHSS